MSMKCGIVGLPNVGKSTLFNALTGLMNAETGNFPFCTIEPNVSRVNVPDDRLDNLAKLASSKETIYATVEFVDIAGLIAGASKGEGLGNQFLGNIRNVNCIAQVVRCFQDKNVSHVSGKIDPIDDITVIETELTLSDIESLEKQLENCNKKAKSQDKEIIKKKHLIEKIIECLNQNQKIHTLDLDDTEQQMMKQFQLLANKPTMYVCNVNEDDSLDDNQYVKQVIDYAKQTNSPVVVVCAKIEEEISQLDDETEKLEFMKMSGIEKKGLDKVIQSAYQLLDYITYFTVGPKEAHAWAIKKNSTAPEAAGTIHTDFQKGFIRAEVITYQDYIDTGNEKEAKNQGKMKLEGKDYVVQDADVIHFRFNV